MNTLLAPQRLSGIPDTQRLTSRAPRTSLFDRIALHLGLALLIWSTRTPRLALDRETHSRSFRAHAARTAREHGHTREGLLLAPRL
jgi:hypothetical protein